MLRKCLLSTSYVLGLCLTATNVFGQSQVSGASGSEIPGSPGAWVASGASGSEIPATAGGIVDGIFGALTELLLAFLGLV